ncbi:MAG: fibrobacter succinogenes major paralogous domain-containing protein [Bacteroidetes bacterium]|nr:fibrobacter succinogenes major paralogous domain-containing protein [Bacteroidota bacterium]
MKKNILTIVALFLIGFANGQVTNVKADFSCPSGITVTYDAPTSGNATLYYSPDNGTTWLEAKTVTKTGNTIVWDNKADNVSFGQFRLKVEVPTPTLGECTVNSTLPVGKLTFLCYNLGADPNMSIEQQMAYTPNPNTVGTTDSKVYGDLYQWGRNTDGHEKRTSSTTTTLATTNTPGHGNFISAPNTPYDWRSGGVQTSRWGDGTSNAKMPKAANDPCPAGYRLPTQQEWASIYNGMNGINTWTWNSTGTPGYKISTDNGTTTALFLPAAGYRFYRNGTLYNAGTDGNYWSSTVDGEYSFILYFSNGYVNPSLNFNRAYGMSVRCLAEY